MMNFCWFYRLIISHNGDEEKDLPARVHRHLKSCAPCRNYFELQTTIAMRLAREAAPLRVDPPPNLQRRIAAGVAQADRAREPQGSLWKWSLAGAAAAVAAVVFALQPFRQMEAPALATNLAPEFKAVETELLGPANQWPSGQTLIKWGQSLDQPLHAELNSVVQDAKTAVHLISQNFLPETLYAANSASWRPR